MSGIGWRGSFGRVVLLLAVVVLFGSVFAVEAETPKVVVLNSGPVLNSEAPWGELVSPSLGATPAAGEGMADKGYRPPASPCRIAGMGSPFIPVDSWMYVSLTRLYTLGYLDTAFLGLRPWTRLSVIHMMEDTGALLEDAPDNATTDEAQEIYDAVMRELNVDASGPCLGHRGQTRLESAYTVGSRGEWHSTA